MTDGSFCPSCGHKRLGNYRFCASCKFDFDELTPGSVPPPASSSEPAMLPPSGRSRTVERVVLLLIVITVLGGAALLFARGGGGRTSATGPSSSPAATMRPTSAPLATMAPTLPPEAGISTACIAELGPLADALMELDSRLAIGMAFAVYSGYVADAQVVYDRINGAALDATCLTEVGVPAEAALTNYVYAYRVWNSCIDKLSCDLDSIEPKLQDYWAKATAQIDEFRLLMR
jgi:hypothetical protein